MLSTLYVITIVRNQGFCYFLDFYKILNIVRDFFVIVCIHLIIIKHQSNLLMNGFSFVPTQVFLHALPTYATSKWMCMSPWEGRDKAKDGRYQLHHTSSRVCYHVYVLETAYYQYRQQYGPVPVEDKHM